MRFVLATTNPGKVAELARILNGLKVELTTLEDLGLDGAAETGTTFEENALIKARAVVEATQLPAIADDSGLEVDALDGEPGVHSARYAGVSGDRDVVDAANNELLIARLQGRLDRAARFVCVAALAVPDGRCWTVRGSMEGTIVDAPRGRNGFGYDPHFVRTGATRTNAQLTPQEKDAVSHRGRAFRELRPVIEAYVAEDSSR